MALSELFLKISLLPIMPYIGIAASVANRQVYAVA